MLLRILYNLGAEETGDEWGRQEFGVKFLGVPRGRERDRVEKSEGRIQ